MRRKEGGHRSRLNSNAHFINPWRYPIRYWIRTPLRTIHRNREAYSPGFFSSVKAQNICSSKIHSEILISSGSDQARTFGVIYTATQDTLKAQCFISRLSLLKTMFYSKSKRAE
ncbi:hypothetical protein CEXT_118871 [Caerostris extrusa]|uniref:Uncharacterized protein n=1 Tax=Caerostris extrusa TaxID=172846 RepID=A0AAV4PBT7_CAEEX|nr:hypothetical protein CEXT_118871 [Caerostris extrusa]